MRNTVNILIFLMILKVSFAEGIQQKESPENNKRIQAQNLKQKCKCQNNGECYSPDRSKYEELQIQQQVYCKCSNFYIGDTCKTQATQLISNKKISEKIISREYKYFFYEPIQENMYSFSITLCFDYIKALASTSSISQKIGQKITFFITVQRQDGFFETEEDINDPTTITIQQNECQRISVDYTVLLVNKVKIIQKLIFALKLGDKLAPEKSKQQKQELLEQSLKKNLQMRGTHSDSQEKQALQKLMLDYHPILYTVQSLDQIQEKQEEQEAVGKKQNIKNINQFKYKSPSKLKQSDDSSPSKIIHIKFTEYPFMVSYMIFNVFFSLTAIISFAVIGALIFIIRSRVLGIRITRNLYINSRLINDIRHFDKYIPQEKYVRKEKKPGDNSPNSSEIQCAICIAKFQQGDLIRKTPCFHSFHISCIDKWCHQNLTCPMCRRSLTEKTLHQYDSSTALQLKNSPQSDE